LCRWCGWCGEEQQQTAQCGDCPRQTFCFHICLAK
jgi:hypothetical protein